MNKAQQKAYLMEYMGWPDDGKSDQSSDEIEDIPNDPDYTPF